MVYEGCSELVLFLAVLGGCLLYSLVGIMVSLFIKEILEYSEDEVFLFFMFAVFWPFAIAGMLVYLVLMWLTVPFWAASRRDVRRAEERLSEKIEDTFFSAAPAQTGGKARKSFKVGDIITGTIPQTDKNGKNISYEHLYSGCKCRVISIDDKDSMRVMLVDHKDKAAHSDYIGNIFTVPARNFKLVKDGVKRGSYKKSKKAKKARK